MAKTHFLFSPGPVMVSDNVRNALLHDDIGHRVPEFTAVLQNLQRNLLKVYRADDRYTVLLITGSGTAANEAVISSYFGNTHHALLLTNGEFGDRLQEMLDIHRIEKTVLRYEYGVRPDPAEVEELLKKNPKISAIIMTFQESAASFINPVQEIGTLAGKYNKTYIVDAVSALGGEDVDVLRDNIDFCTCSSNKCLGSLPGVGIICAKRSKLEEMRNNRPKTAYLNLLRLYDMSEQYHQTTNTPSTTQFFALDAAVKELLDEGMEERIARYKRCARILRDGVKKMGLRMFIDEKDASNTITSVLLPEYIDMDDFVQRMEVKGYTVYPGKGHLKDLNLFQIGNMGNIFEEMCTPFLETMSETLHELQD
ncbi:MAG: alanine--glyoxylate aminotransferase family protein [Spirochaetes bacterium]|nr:alanine--glyoxylate aminotransferase family protein [Spirochaetota bacterium]